MPGLADPILGPYKNDKQARAAQNGALPPDLSLITKARTLEIESSWPRQWLRMGADILKGYQEGGADYVYDLLTGYRDPPPGMEVPDGMYYNITFPGHRLAMPPPLAKDNFVEYQADAGAKGSLEQNARDIAAFLTWAADPNLDARKQLGWLVRALPRHHDGAALSGQAAHLEPRPALTDPASCSWDAVFAFAGSRLRAKQGLRQQSSGGASWGDAQ